MIKAGRPPKTAGALLPPPRIFIIMPFMAINIEIKAKLNNREEVEARAAALADGPAQVLNQADTFFNNEKGRLKLREEGGEGQLIYYERPDGEAPKPSEYFIARTPDSDILLNVLTGALGIRGQVVKERTLYLKGSTRIHLDRVEGLGDYMELEVVLNEGLSLEEGHAIAEQLLDELGIPREDLVRGAYMDLLER